MPDLAIRPYVDADEPAVLDLLAASLGRVADDRYRDLFRWKHLQNPFGRSFMWVGEVDGHFAGFRSFLRWRFVDPGGEPVEAARAVDTATHPDFQGMGIFRTLTMHGLDEMRAAGVSFVFNTPNDQSRPGYLKMGWRIDGRVPVKVRPRTVGALWRMARSRTPAETWSLPVDVGDPSDEIDTMVEATIQPASDALITHKAPDFMVWRYAALHDVASRAVRVDGGAVLARFRRRGRAVECTVGDVIGAPLPSAASRALRRALRDVAADYAIASATTQIDGMVQARRLGPVQTRRDLSSPTTLPLTLTLSDVELF